MNFNNLTIPELKNFARTRGIGGLSRLRKNELVVLLQQFGQQPTQQTINNLPSDMQVELLANMDLNELRKLCTSNKQLRQLCQSELLWQRLVAHRFGKVELINNSWRETYIYYYQIIQPYINIFGSIKTFLNVMLPSLLEYMTIIPQEADRYRINLPPSFIQDYDNAVYNEEMIDQINELYQQYRALNPIDHPNPDQLYELDIDKLLANINQENYNFADEVLQRLYDELNPDPYRSFDVDILQGSIDELKDPYDFKQLRALLDKLKDPNYLKQFLTTAIPNLHYVTLVNPAGVNYDARSLLNIHYRNGRPGLNILETGESFEHKINKYHVSCLDLLKAIMSVKSAKEDFNYEQFYGIEYFDPETQTLTLSFGHGS